MNERLREILEDAEVIFDNPDAHVPLALVSMEDFKLITEMIVRECLDACGRANEIRHFVPPTQEQVVLSCMREIETTFRS
jgi:hypothetical protein